MGGEAFGDSAQTRRIGTGWDENRDERSGMGMSTGMDMAMGMGCGYGRGVRM